MRWESGGCGDGRGGKDLMGTCCLNNEWPLGLCVCGGGVRARDCSQRARVKKKKKNKRVAFEGLTFICGTMSHFRASQPAVLCVRRGFFPANVSLKCKWTFPLFFLFFLSNKERNQDRVEALFVCHHTVTFLLISGPAAR